MVLSFALSVREPCIGLQDDMVVNGSDCVVHNVLNRYVSVDTVFNFMNKGAHLASRCLTLRSISPHKVSWKVGSTGQVLDDGLESTDRCRK